MTQAEMVGVVRERSMPVLTQIADSAYVHLAMMELGRRSWDPRYVSSSSIASLAERMHSDVGLAELQDRLGVLSRTTELFVIFTADGRVFADGPPEPDATGRQNPFLDIRKIAQAIHNKVDGRLFYGARADCGLAA